MKMKMNKLKIERLIYTFLIILLFFVGYNFGINDKKIKLCESFGENVFYASVNEKEGCIKYEGELCKDQCFGGVGFIPNINFTFEIKNDTVR
jgi:hypothetical protein